MSEPQPSSVNSAMDAMPGWMKAVMLFGNTFGVTALILAFFLAQDAGIIDNPVAKELQELKGLSIKHETTMQELARQVAEQARQLEEEAEGRKMRCIMRAQTEAQKKACFGKQE